MKNWTGWKNMFKTYFSEWAAPTVYLRKKPNQIRVCADFSTGLNRALKDHHYPLHSPEEIFKKPNGCRIISKIHYRTHIFKSGWKRILNRFLFSLQKKPLGRGVLWDRYLPIDGLSQILHLARAKYSRRWGDWPAGR